MAFDGGLLGLIGIKVPTGYIIALSVISGYFLAYYHCVKGIIPYFKKKPNQYKVIKKRKERKEWLKYPQKYHAGLLQVLQ